mgnify:CR=1 FL=1
MYQHNKINQYLHGILKILMEALKFTLEVITKYLQI